MLTQPFKDALKHLIHLALNLKLVSHSRKELLVGRAPLYISLLLLDSMDSIIQLCS